MQRTKARTFSSTSQRNRRRAGIVIAGALIALPALTGCSKLTGFDVETDKQYVPGNGANYRVASVDAPVDVVGIVIVSAEDGQGTLVATFVNNDLDATSTPEITSEVVEITDYAPFELDGNAMVNFASDAWVEEDNPPVVVTGEDIVVGASIPFTIGEGSLAEELWVPVVPNTETTSTLPRADEHGEGHGDEEEHGSEGEHGEEAGHEGEDDSPNPWAGLDRSQEEAPAEVPETVDPAGTDTEG